MERRVSDSERAEERGLRSLSVERQRYCRVVVVDNPLTPDSSWVPCPNRGFRAQRVRECLPTGDYSWTYGLFQAKSPEPIVSLALEDGELGS